MRLATIAVKEPKTASERRDGRLAVVGADGCQAALVPPEIAPSLLSALEEWDKAEPRLRAVEEKLKAGRWERKTDISRERLMAPLPRTYAWLDGSAFISHILLARKARGAEPPEDLRTAPLMYQGISDNLLGPNDDIPLLDEAHGLDFEAEVAVALDEVPLSTSAAQAGGHVKLILLMNDVSLRHLIPRELAAGFGFFHGKPASSFAPFAVTPEEAGEAWREGRLHLELRTSLNGRPFGHPNAGEMFFSFHDLIAHAAKTRVLSAGTILGSGTVSNADESVGAGCLAERRMIEKIKTGAMKTPFLKATDHIEMEMIHNGRSLFGKISQKVAPGKVPA